MVKGEKNKLLTCLFIYESFTISFTLSTLSHINMKYTKQTQDLAVVVYLIEPRPRTAHH